ncbi:10205_t:CDS:2 [Ambispora leptoticha]|uniref:10205_t:CDS:1 n=1 Tax=Ambispora leptoticha TaxID=144679 RepID=A0A9N8WJ44_9GLOM|nr:10205_t:CDS:2 [Ambispora leptoticha]
MYFIISKPLLSTRFSFRTITTIKKHIFLPNSRNFYVGGVRLSIGSSSSRSTFSKHNLLKCSWKGTKTRVGYTSRQLRELSSRTMQQQRLPDSTSVDRDLVYVGPLSHHLRRFKQYAILISVSGAILIPYVLMYGKANYGGIAMAFLSSIIPVIVVNVLSSPYVNRLYIDIPRHIRFKVKQNPFDPAILKKDRNPIITFETFNWRGKPVETRVPLKELRESTRKVKYVTWERIQSKNNDDNDNSGKDRHGFFDGERTEFYVETEIMRQNPYTAGLIDWIKNKNVISKNKDQS